MLDPKNNNTLFKFLIELTNEERAIQVRNEYRLGTAKFWYGSSVFWQIDFQNNVRNGKIIQYALKPDDKSSIGVDCKRVKGNVPPVKWVSKLMKAKDFNLVQCFFGEHLLAKYPDRNVGIFESEKTALIAACYNPEIIWLACGSLTGLTDTKTSVLKDRNVVLWPDLGMFNQWEEKAKEIRKKVRGISISTTNFLEGIASEEERKSGFDLGDYLVRTQYLTPAKLL